MKKRTPCDKIPASSLTITRHFAYEDFPLIDSKTLEHKELWNNMDKVVCSVDLNKIEATCSRVYGAILNRAQNVHQYILGDDVTTEAALR